MVLNLAPNELELIISRRPVTQVGGEIRGFCERAEYLLSLAPSALEDISLVDSDKPGFKRYLKRTPLGVVLIIVPWKYVP